MDRALGQAEKAATAFYGRGQSAIYRGTTASNMRGSNSTPGMIKDTTIHCGMLLLKN